jgi:hypothetical protein
MFMDFYSLKIRWRTAHHSIEKSIIHLKSIDEKDLEKELMTLGVDEKLQHLHLISPKILKKQPFLQKSQFLEMIQFIEILCYLWPKKDVSFPTLFTEKAVFSCTRSRLFSKAF